MSIELLHEDIGVVGGNGSSTDLSGFNTYRVYLECEGSADKLSAIEGNDNRPLNVSSTTGFYQTSLFSGSANALPNFISPILYTSFPDIVYDSWVTIGIEETADSGANETEVKLTEDSSNPLSNGFATGNDLVINSADGSSWYIQDSDNHSNGLAGADSKVLVAQLTTDGQISGQMGMQVFRNGISTTENCARPYLSFQSHGCMESSACNYAPTAIIDDGSCDFCSCPDSVQVLSASFPNDSIPSLSLEVEIIADHDTTEINTNVFGTPDPLAGMKTYRVYAQVDDASTLVTAGFGGTAAALDISSTAPFYMSPLGGITPSNNSASLFEISPYRDLKYDSWVTIGLDRATSQMPDSPSGLDYVDVSTIGDWDAEFSNGGGLYASGNIGGTWFAYPSSANVIPDENLRVLIAQFTTAGVVSGTLGLQVVPETAPSDSTNDYRLPFSFTTEGLGDALGFPEACTCENVDNDYLCDDVDPCIGIVDECGICNGPGILEGDCDCEGNQLDILGVCGGECTTDEDNDGLCDDVDPCVGAFDDCGVCNGPGAVYDCGCFDQPADDCDCEGNQLDAAGLCGGTCTLDADNDGVCDTDEINGCTDSGACNYLDIATEEDDSCLYFDAIGECGGNCEVDVDSNGVCDTNDQLHCGPGTEWNGELGLCVISCPTDINLDGATAIGDLLLLLASFASLCSDTE